MCVNSLGPPKKNRDREGRLKDKFAFFEAYKNPIPKRRKLLAKKNFNKQKGPCLKTPLNWTGSVFPLLKILANMQENEAKPIQSYLYPDCDFHRCLSFKTFRRPLFGYSWPSVISNTTAFALLGTFHLWPCMSHMVLVGGHVSEQKLFFKNLNQSCTGRCMS